MSKQYSRAFERYNARRFHEGKVAYWQRRGPGRGKAVSMGYIAAHREVMADVKENAEAIADERTNRRGF